MPSINRIVMNRESQRLMQLIGVKDFAVAEISGKWGRRLACKSYEQFYFPEFDIRKGPFRADNGRIRKFDLILANQVWEHLDRPYAALSHMRKMLKSGGYFWMAVPFFIPHHAAPYDCSRWSARGLHNLLAEAGFDEAEIHTDQWGNRAAAARNLEKPWPPEYDKARDDLTNDPNFPICAWALARKT